MPNSQPSQSNHSPMPPAMQPISQSAPVAPLEDYSKTQVQLYLGSAIQFKQRPSSGKGGLLTLFIEIAPYKQGQNRVGDWQQSIKFQLTPDTETIQFAHVLMGRLSQIDFKFHGESNDKSLSAKWNDDGTLFIGIREAKKSAFVKLPPTAVFSVLTLTTKVIALRHGINTSSTLDLLRSVPPAVS